MQFIGDGIPGVNAEQLAGKLIVIEGADGSGRSTQVEILRDHLENLGHATVNVGLRRSFLVADELQQAKQGNVLGEITRSLFYATDFADQLENRIIPALKAGFIVLADRYIYTLMARDLVRGADAEWLRSLYGIALVPDLVIYLKVNPAQLVERNLAKNSTLDYWESGMDLGLSRDSFDSFIRYQKLIQREFSDLQQQYDFAVVNGNLSVRAISHEINRRVAEIL
ncbi:MAG TPA: thymidylate kinase [Geobacteraceae bacterium]